MPETLAELLQGYRSAARLSQEALAERASLSARTISDIETGVAKTPRLVTILLLAEALGLEDAERATLQEAGRKPVTQRAARDATPVPFPLPEPLVGRDADVAAIGALVTRETVRLVTLCGPAGVGKTSLAVRVASDRRDAFSAGPVFAELAPVVDPAAVPAAIAHVLGIRAGDPAALRDAVVTRLRSGTTLLVLDNLEHLTPVAVWLLELLEACPGVTILGTSREPLHVKPEHVVPIKPLERSAAAALFVSRAQAVKPGFTVSETNREAIEAIVARLDGLPLAIELAAPRLRILPPKALAARLDRRLSMLDDGAVDLPARQQTMRNAIAWSYDLLSPEEQSLFRRLCTLQGGGSLEAARAVADDTTSSFPAFLLRIAALVEKNLLTLHEDPDGEPRLTMLDMLREFALEQLEGEELKGVRTRHAAFFSELAEVARVELTGAQQAAWLSRLFRERLNLLAALAWYQECGEVEAGIRLAYAISRFWWLRGDLAEGKAWLSRFLEADAPTPVPPAVRARALRALVMLMSAIGTFDEALGPCEEAVRLQRAIGDDAGLGASLTSLGIIKQFRGDLDAARAAHEESLAIRRRINDELGMATSLSNLASTAYTAERLGEAARFADECMAIYRRLGHTAGMSHALTRLGLVAVRRGDYESGQRLFEESLSLQRTLGPTGNSFYALGNLAGVAYKRGNYELALERYREAIEILDTIPNQAAIAGVLEGIASALSETGHTHRAARLFGFTDALRHTLNSPVFPAEREDYDAAIASTRAALGAVTFDTEWQLGAIMTVDRAIDEARATVRP